MFSFKDLPSLEFFSLKTVRLFIRNKHMDTWSEKFTPSPSPDYRRPSQRVTGIRKRIERRKVVHYLSVVVLPSSFIKSFDHTFIVIQGC